MKKLISLVLTMVITISLLTGITVNASIADSGFCGTNLTWSLDEYGVLTVSGVGEMCEFYIDYYTGDSDRPWKEHLENISAIYIGNGVTSISANAFSDAVSVEKVVISDTVKSIGEYAFGVNRNLKYVIIGDGVEQIEKFAFFAACIDTLYLGKNVKFIGEHAFNSNNGFWVGSPFTTITNLFYPGTREQLNGIVIESGNRLEGSPGKNRVYLNCDERYKTNIPEFCKLKIGDYVELGRFGGAPKVDDFGIEAGKFNNEPIIWRVLNINRNKVMLLSQDYVMETKPFDAIGDDETYHGLGKRKERGSNNWRDSSIRQWLNSDEKTVTWTHCPPATNERGSYDRVTVTWHSNGYDDKPGFLSDNYFTQYEKNCIVKTQNHFIDTEDGDYTTDDYVFLLSEFEVDFFADDLRDLRCPDGLISSNRDHYWLRENMRPKYSEADMWADGIHTDQEYFVGIAAYTKVKGRLNAGARANIRPAMIVDLSKISFNHGDGTKGNPHTYTKVLLNDSYVDFDQSPIIQDGRTLVPVRAIFESLGGTVDWNGDTQTVTSTKGDKTISMNIGSNIMLKNGQEIMLDVSPQIVNSRTLVPVRAIAECFNCRVEWDNDKKTVIINE